MAKEQRKYDMEFKIQAVKLAKEIGGAKAAAELGIPENTMYAWTKAAGEGRLDAGPGSHTPKTAETAGRRPHSRRKNRLPHYEGNRTQPPPETQTERNYQS